MGGDKKTILFESEELDDLIKDEQHEEVMALLQQLIDSSKDGEKWKEIANAINGNAAQLSRFVEAFKNLKIEVPTSQITVGSPDVKVDVKQEEVVKAIRGMFDEMKEILGEVKKSNERLSTNVREMNESYRADKVMQVYWNSGMVDKITVKVKK